jgi:cytochrome b561
MRDLPYRYGSFSQCLHWSSALLTLVVFGLGLWMVTLDYYHTWYHRGPALHVSLGLLLLLLTVVRLCWRAINRAPAPLASHSRAAVMAARGLKYLLYLLLLTLLLSGYLMTTAEGQAARFFELISVPALFDLSGGRVDLLGQLHLWGAWALIVLVAGHAGAALLHHVVYKDATLKRMLPGATLDSGASAAEFTETYANDTTPQSPQCKDISKG